MQSISEIIFEEVSGRNGNLGIITLNRPEALNALNHVMFLAMQKQLTEWENASHIKGVIIKAVPGRAFCAGGDIKHAYQLRDKNDSSLLTFFKDEYDLNRHIYHYSKPYIALLDGITMGGGVGISLHGSHKIGTKNLVFAMPETTIGFYPDVGGTFILANLPDKIGFYLGLTGARVAYNDCLDLNLVNQIVDPNQFPEIIFAIADASFDEDSKSLINSIIKKFKQEIPHSVLLEHKAVIQKTFSKNSIEEIIQALELEDEWGQMIASQLKIKSPTSLKVTLEALKKAENADFDTCMQNEFLLTSHFIRGHDFFEGVRAVLIDKDQKPHWKPSRIEEVSKKDVEKYFLPLEQEILN